MTGQAPNQDDMSDVYTYSQEVETGDTWAYLGFRRLTTSGTTNFDVEFNQLENSDAQNTSSRPGLWTTSWSVSSRTGTLPST